MTARSSRTPPADAWATAWRAALAAVGVADERPTAELIALGAVHRFRNSPMTPGAKALRDAAADVPAAARWLARSLGTYRAAAVTTPAAQAERRAALVPLASDLAAEFRLDPYGPAGLHLDILGAPHELERAAERAERRIASAQLDQLPPAPPRAPRPNFDRFIADLGGAYSSATGCRPSAATNGMGFIAPFVRFTAAIWSEASDGPAPRYGAIAGALRRVSPLTVEDQPQARGMASRACRATQPTS